MGGSVTNGRFAAVLIVVGGAAATLGSFTNWGYCSKEPCEGPGGLSHLFPVSGVDIGPGIPTALLGTFLVIAGIEAFRRGGELPYRRAALVAAVGVVVIVALWTIYYTLPPGSFFYGPGGDYVFVIPGGILAAAGSFKLREPGGSRRRGPPPIRR